MKKIILLLVALLAFVTAHADSYYRVTSDNVNVRKGPGTDYEVVETLKLDEKIVCMDKDKEGWMEYRVGKRKIGYVNSKFLEYVEPVEKERIGVQLDEATLEKLDFIPKMSDKTSLSVLTALALVVALLVFVRKNSVLMVPALILLSIWEFYYWLLSKDPTWFGRPEEVGWGLTAVGVVLFAALFLVQVMGFFNTMISYPDQRMEDSGILLIVTIFYWGISFLLLFFGGLFMSDKTLLIVLLVLAVAYFIYGTVVFMLKKAYILGPVYMLLMVIGPMAIFFTGVIFIFFLLKTVFLTIRLIIYACGGILLAGLIIGGGSGNKKGDTKYFQGEGWKEYDGQRWKSLKRY